MGEDFKLAYLGAGEYPMTGAINVDIRPLPGIDIVSDVRKLPFKDGELDGIASRNLVEHFARLDIIPMFKEWTRCIRHEGFVQIETVDAGRLMDKWRGMNIDELLDGILGAQTYDENFHKMLFTEDILISTLQVAGLTVGKIERFEHRNIPRIKIVGYKLYDSPQAEVHTKADKKHPKRAKKGV